MLVFFRARLGESLVWKNFLERERESPDSIISHTLFKRLAEIKWMQTVMWCALKVLIFTGIEFNQDSRINFDFCVCKIKYSQRFFSPTDITL